jgi:hypothetical protein
MESAATPQVFLAFVAHKWPPFSDEFDGPQLDPAKWVASGNPIVRDGKLWLSDGDDVQSTVTFRRGVLNAAIESSDWKPHNNRRSDSSFGLEIWTGANGKCHYGALLKANGHLGVLCSEPDASNSCYGDPEHQEYPRISNWDAVRVTGTVYLTLTWSVNGVTLCVTDGSSESGLASHTGEAEPTVPLRIRLHADAGETYAIDHIRVLPDP